jgi:hypothetical protein
MNNPRVALSISQCSNVVEISYSFLCIDGFGFEQMKFNIETNQVTKLLSISIRFELPLFLPSRLAQPSLNYMTHSENINLGLHLYGLYLYKRNNLLTRNSPLMFEKS